MSDARPAWIHPTALVEEGVTLGGNTRVWDGVHIRKNARIGHDCIVGEKTYVAYGVVIGNYVKINAVVYICAEVEIEDFVMISAHTVFTNDRFPRSGNKELTGLETSDPTEETLTHYAEIESKRAKVVAQLKELRETSSTTRDGRHVVLSANIELPEDVDAVAANGAEGIGLYRTEFLYLNRTTLPTEEEQYKTYRKVAERVRPNPLIIRTFDLGGDKLAPGTVDISDELNPFLGWRAIRFCLENIDIFKTQLRAILRASAVGNVKIMFPMISGVDELRRAIAVLAECKEELCSSNIDIGEKIEVGAMIEIPSAAISANVLAPEVDFFSIGTNDLIQYTLAVDRVNEKIAHLYEPTHPAVLRLLKMVADAGHASDIWVGVCGEMAGDIALIPLLLGLGVDELSASATLVPRVKRAVQSLAIPECRELVQEALELDTASEILARCLKLADERYGDLLG